jgi:cation diffusion facilitator CzcD-associated flavoprotein CzcO
MSTHDANGTAAQTIGIIGAGAAGLVTAQVLLRDGFDVQIITRDKSVGGVWAKERVYPGLNINKCEIHKITNQSLV